MKDPPNSTRQINENHITIEQHKLQELCLREISHREKYINSKVLGNPYPSYTDQTIYRKTGERIDIISDTNSYTEEIIIKLPSMNSVLYPVCSMEMSYHLSNFLSHKGIDWEPFGFERKIELQRIEGTAFFHQLRKLNLTHAWKEIYTNTNLFCDAHGVPYKKRKNLYLREIEMISLHIHDCLPHNYAEQGIWTGDASLSNYYIFFSPYDPLPIARKKWKDFIGDDYEYFWKSFISNDFECLNDEDYVKLDDLFQIIKFINPEGIRLFLKKNEFHRKTIFIKRKAKNARHWVLSRHKAYYAWIIFGWRVLPHSTPSYNSSENPDFPIPSRWVPKSLSYQDFINKDLYKIYKRNDYLQHHTFYSKKFTNLQEKKSLITKNDYNQEYEFYNSIQRMKIPSSYITYFSNPSQKEKSEIFFFNIITRHNQLHKKEIEHSNKLQKSRTDILKSTGILPPKNFKETWPIDWLVFYDYYSRKPRDNNFTYSKLIVTASYWRNKNSRTGFPLLEINREKGQTVSPSPPTKINYIQTIYSNFSTTPTTTKYVIINDDFKVRQPYFLDEYEKGSYQYYATEAITSSTQEFSTEFDTEFELYNFINLYFIETEDFYSTQLRAYKDQCLQDNAEIFLSVSDFPISNYEMELRKTRNLDSSDTYARRVYHVSDSSTESRTNNFRTQKNLSRTCTYHRPRTNIKNNLSGSSENTYVYSIEENSDPMYESFFSPTENDSDSYLPEDYDVPMLSNATQRSSELSFVHCSSPFNNVDDRISNDKFLIKKVPSQNSDNPSEPPHIFLTTNQSSAFTNFDPVPDRDLRTYQKRSFSCSDISTFRNSEWDSIGIDNISVSKSMPSICTDNDFQYVSKSSNLFSTYDFALSTTHTTEKAENNLNDGTIVTDMSTSTNPTSTKNNKDSNNNNTYESLSNYNTELLSTNSSSIAPTSEINRSLIDLTKNVRRNMRTAKNEFDKLFIGNSEHTESGTSTSPPRKIPIKENTDGKIPDTPSGKINFSNPIHTNTSVLNCNEDDQNDMSIFTKSTRHNQIVSLLTEIDDTNINEVSPSKSILMHEKDESELQNITADEDGDEEPFSISNKSCTIIHSLDDPSPPDPSDNSTSSSSDMFSDSSSDSSIMSKSNSSSSNDLLKKENNNFKKNRRPLSDKKLCNQTLNMIKFWAQST